MSTQAKKEPGKEDADRPTTEAWDEYRRLADASKALDATPAGGKSP